MRLHASLLERLAPDPSQPSPTHHQEELKRCTLFLKEYQDQVSGKKYLKQILEVKRRQLKTIRIELADVLLMKAEGDSVGGDFVGKIERNTSRYIELFKLAVMKLLFENMKEPGPLAVDTDGSHDQMELLMMQRYHQLREVQRAAGEEEISYESFIENIPKELLCHFDLRIINRDNIETLPLRQVSAGSLGKLVEVRAIVLRCTDVKPMLSHASYSCDTCSFEHTHGVEGKTFMPMTACETCTKNKNFGKLHMNHSRSKWVKYQELTVQELSKDVPTGDIPRTMTVVCTGELTREVKPGVEIILGGIFKPTPFTGYQALKAGLTTDTYLEAQSINVLKHTEQKGLDDPTRKRIIELSENDPYGALSRSIAPEIFGLEDVKKVLLLQLVGGESRSQADGMRTRGDINVLLMGDPGVAKSQLLKKIKSIAPRCVYTTGKGSSGVGLTAAVVRDPMTGDLMLEGGALVLADMGICAIDEFDKMEEADRTAIHEVMEQQTVSIAKAGITTTLNARTAILAAANPKYSRYNRLADRDAQVALTKNINLPAALLSRFDIIFLMLDTADRDNDTSLAEHLTYVHKNACEPPQDFIPFEPSFLRQYIAAAKYVQPYVSSELRDYIVEAYVDIRSKDRARAVETKSQATTTARQLLSILRIAEAHAKIAFRDQVSQADIDEAIRLIQMSKASVLETDIDAGHVRADPGSRIWDLVKDKLSNKPFFMSFEAAKELSLRAGFSDEDFDRFIAEYEGLSIIQINASRTRIECVGFAEEWDLHAASKFLTKLLSPHPPQLHYPTVLRQPNETGTTILSRKLAQQR